MNNFQQANFMKKALFLCFVFFSFLASAQQKITVKGSVIDDTNQSLPFTTVSLLNPKDSTNIANQFSKDDGSFEFQGLTTKNYLLKISLVGYTPFFQLIETKGQETIDLGEIHLKSADNILNEVIVKGNKEPVAVKKDTLEFDAGVLKPQQNDNLEELLRKVPALEIDENGGIKTQNKVVKKIYIDGKEFFGNDPQLAKKSSCRVN